MAGKLLGYGERKCSLALVQWFYQAGFRFLTRIAISERKVSV